ncbi:hypothetical protein U1Q18_052632 [Sarracenia purpurea var. burkii]
MFVFLIFVSNFAAFLEKILLFCGHISELDTRRISLSELSSRFPHIGSITLGSSISFDIGPKPKYNFEFEFKFVPSASTATSLPALGCTTISSEKAMIGPCDLV